MRQLSNIRAVLLATLAAFSTTAHLSAAEDHHIPKFGGVVVETKAGDIEIVAKPESLQIYITDHGKPMKIDGAKAKVTLLNGTEKSEIELAVAGNKLEAKGDFKVVKGTKGIAMVTLAGKPPVTARFQIK